MATSFYILLAAAFCRFVDSTDNIAYSPIIQKIQNDVFQVKTDIATAMTTIDVKLKDIAVRLDTIESREQQLAKTAAFQKRMNQTDQECSHLNNHAYIACYFKGLGVISRSGVYVVSAGAQLLAAECDRLRPKEVEGIAKDCNSVNDEPDLSSARRAELLLLCVAHKVDPDVCNIPIPSYNGKETTID
ncbi:uncharacterized protein LOC125240024 isoform X2 [Leguminivora glycinivorella]|uniref:uncharacterized protein LOC125240024 isoform X2 n=1 Tax=Leguminivora glycinivorella TaxID=1035111 RepID=UPI00200E881D|nr:uncharacterized protein LOC125240024 isoform X2 [Leguminivora glycinivorella]